MPQQAAKSPPIVDPDRIPETLCDGRMNVHWVGAMATLTFTHPRPVPTNLFGGVVNIEEVVRARIAMSLDTAIALRDLLNRVINDGSPQIPTGGASSEKLR